MISSSLVHNRYRLLRNLGQGSAGVVYGAHDVTLDRRVALKTLRSLGPDEIYGLKKEFRSLAGVAHPNLVQLYDLVADEDRWFFTMELVDGRSFVDALQRAGSSGGPDFARLRDAVRQLVAALGTLHGHEKLHRDIKPTNVLVERGGRVVLVDFSLVANLAARGSRDSRDRGLAGTLAYMSPEQLWGAAVTPASDWYGVGAMLYETLTGRTPHDGAELAPDRGTCVPSPRQLGATTPADLDELVMELLRPKPGDRPSPAQILARLAHTGSGTRPSAPSGPASASPDRVGFVGRTVEREALEAALLDGVGRRLRLVAVEGPSGIGKSALVEHFAAAQEERVEALVLQARCHPQESLPFKAVDGIVDGLVDYLDAQPRAVRATLVPKDGAVLARLFPVFGSVCPEEPDAGGDPHEIRRRAFAVLRTLLGRVAARQPTVVWIDDLQWGDLDSMALVRELVCPPEPPTMLLVLSFRSEVDDGRRLLHEIATSAQVVTEDGELLWLRLGALSGEETIRLATGMLAGCGAAAAIAAESGGNPLIAAELARHVAAVGVGAAATPLRFADVVAARIARLPAATRRLLELLAIAGEPLAERLVYRLARPTSEAIDAVIELRRQCLVCPAVRAGESALGPWHHRIGEVVSSLLGADERRALHRDIAEALENLPDADPHQLVEHYLGAGELRRAGEHAFAAAERAVGVLAFHRAARLYRQALELGTTACPVWQLNARLGEALINAGRAGEGAGRLALAACALAASEPGSREALRLERRAAEHYLRSGMPTEGLAALRRVLAAVQLRYARSPITALASLIVNRARVDLRRWLRPSGTVARVGDVERERLEACWSAGVGLSVFDQIRAADFQVRHALLAHPAGDRAHLARSLATGGLILAWEGGTRKRRRAQALRHAGERLARETGDANVRAHGLLMGAISAYYEFRLREALALCEEGERLCRERCVGAVWELANFQVLTGNTLACLGELPRLRAHLAEVLRQAREREDRYCLVIARIGYNNMSWLVADRPVEARWQAEDAVAGPFPSSFAWQVYQGAFALAQVDLYDGDGETGWRRSVRTWSALRRVHMLRFLPTRVDMRHVWARCALLRARTEAPAERARMLAFAASAARRIRREDAHWVAPFAGSLRAGVLALRGRDAAASQCLAEAAIGFDELDMALHAAAARHQLGLLRDGVGSADATAWMRARGVAAPARLADMIIPVPTHVGTGSGPRG